MLCLGLSSSLVSAGQRLEWHKEVTGKVPDLKEQVAGIHGRIAQVAGREQQAHGRCMPGQGVTCWQSTWGMGAAQNTSKWGARMVHTCHGVPLCRLQGCSARTGKMLHLVLACNSTCALARYAWTAIQLWQRLQKIQQHARCTCCRKLCAIEHNDANGCTCCRQQQHADVQVDASVAGAATECAKGGSVHAHGCGCCKEATRGRNQVCKGAQVDR
jgi:hypothetical protein